MASVDPVQQAALPFRVYGLETRAGTVDASIDRLQRSVAGHSEAIGAQAVLIARHDEQLGKGNENIVDLKTDVTALAISVGTLAERVAAATNRVAWTLTAFAFTTAASVLVLVLTQPGS
jgi:environmental stress-induced protein Ves